MGDMSELKGLLTIGGTITVFILLLTYVPSEFLIPDVDDRYIEVLPYFETIDIINFADTWSNNIDNGTEVYLGFWVQQLDDGDGDFGGHHIDIVTDRDYNPNNGYIAMRKPRKLWWFIIGYDWFDWYDNNGMNHGDILSGDELNATYIDYDNLDFTVKLKAKPHTSFSVFFDFNETAYDDPLDAWDVDELYVFCGISFDQVVTGTNALTLVQDLLFFNLPNTHPAINALIGVPLWIGILYIAFIVVLRGIGAVFGGGA
jgi:hypothetical protein